MGSAGKSKKAAATVSLEGQRQLAYFAERRDAMVATIRELVEIESPSDNKAAVDGLEHAVQGDRDANF